MENRQADTSRSTEAATTGKYKPTASFFFLTSPPVAIHIVGLCGLSISEGAAAKGCFYS